MESSLNERLFITEKSSLEDIKVQEVNGVPYFVIPIYAPYPGGGQPERVAGKNYQEEYQKTLEEHIELTQTLQDLLYERDSLLKSQGSSSNPTVSSEVPKDKKEIIRSRRLAKDITRHFKCSICNKSYGSEGSLKHHLKLKHKENI